MNIAIYIDAEDLAIAINKFLSLRGITSKLVYKSDNLELSGFDIIICSDDRLDLLTAVHHLKKLIITHNDALTGTGYLKRPFTADELLNKLLLL